MTVMNTIQTQTQSTPTLPRSKDTDQPGFSLVFGPHEFDRIQNKAAAINQSATVSQVESVLQSAKAGKTLSIDDLHILLSDTADALLEEMAVVARDITLRRFGRTMQMYAPMYLSNICYSNCTYCGFAYHNKIKRLTLTPAQIVADADVLYNQGMRHILLLTGEAYRETPVEYIGAACESIRDKFPSISIEVYPLKETDYRYLRQKGVDGLTVYQETYDPVRYKEVHLKGMKSNMTWRLDCPDRGGRAGLRKLSIGALLGLSDPTAEVVSLATHARYLLKNYWQSQLSVSLPRLRPAEGLTDVPHIADRQYVRYWLALRLFLPDAGLTLSTRESSQFRDQMMQICITQVSAGSHTEPGGYSGLDSTEQFSIDDNRSIAEVAKAIEAIGKEPVFTDWVTILK